MLLLLQAAYVPVSLVGPSSRLVERRLDHDRGHGTAADLDPEARAGLDVRRVDPGEPDALAGQRRERARADLAHGVPVAVEDAVALARDGAVDHADAHQAARAVAAPHRLAAVERLVLDDPCEVGAERVRRLRQLVPVQRVARLEAQRVAGAE